MGKKNGDKGGENSTTQEPVKDAEVVEVKTREVQAPQNQSVEGLISQAISQGLPVETMERLFALREKVKAEQAREAFVEAMSQFQSVCPIIEKTKVVMNKDGQSVRYKFAPLDAIADQIKKPLADNSLAYKWVVENKPGVINATCIVYHKLGHSEPSSFEVPIDTEGYMTAPQKYASALTFAKRYSLLNALGISTGDEDTDATDVGKEKAPLNDKSKIVFLLRTLKEPTSDKTKIEEAVKKLTSLDLVEANYGEIVSRLELLVKERQSDEDAKV